MRNLLLIEDDDDLRAIMRTSLEEEGYEVVAVHTAATGIAATEMLKFDAIFLDLCLGDIDEDTLLEQFAAIENRPPVIIVSGLPLPEIVAAMKKMKADKVLQKPATIDQIINTAKAAILQGKEKIVA